MKKLGKWELIKKLGSGGFAEVWLATGPNSKGAPLVALKLVHAHLADHPQFHKLLQEEAWAASVLSHPNVVEIYEVSTAKGRPYLAMEFIPGQSLHALLRKLNDKGERISVEEAAYAINQAALGLHYAHEVVGREGQHLGLVHRDISPHNLIAADDGRVKVVDFGLAKFTSAKGGITGEMEGKMAYMPPEQIEGDDVDRRVDTFALGACLWELLAGAKLYSGAGTAELVQQALVLPPPDPRLVFSHLPPALADVLGVAITRDRGKRYQTALELAEALEPFISDDAATKLAKRIHSHFEYMPRTKEEALGLDKPAGPARRATVSSPKVPISGSGGTGARRTSGSTKKLRRPTKEAVEVEPRPRGRRIALALVVLLPLIAVGVFIGANFVGKYLPSFQQAPDLTSDELFEADSGVAEEEVDAGIVVEPPKAKTKKRPRDAGQQTL